MEHYTGEIRMFAGNYAPQGWDLCFGQALAITDYPQLYAVLSTTYGGDGQRYFNLPDLRGRIPIHQGQGPGLSSRTAGQEAGMETVTLSLNQLPAHNHPMQASSDAATAASPVRNVLATPADGDDIYLVPEGPSDLVPLADNAIAEEGLGQPHTNLMPSLCIQFIIAVGGLYPTQA